MKATGVLALLLMATPAFAQRKAQQLAIDWFSEHLKK